MCKMGTKKSLPAPMIERRRSAKAQAGMTQLPHQRSQSPPATSLICFQLPRYMFALLR